MAPTATMGPVERVKNAMDILKTVQASDLKIEKKVLYIPLYSGTALARKNSENGTYGTDEVVRKNIYYLAEQLKNVQQLLIQLIQRGFLNLSERENIVRHEDQFLMCVELLANLIKKDSSRFKLLLEILQETGNTEIVDLLVNTIVPENLGSIPVEDIGVGAGGASMTETPTRKIKLTAPATPVEPWFCRHCTFKNDNGHICAMCAKTNEKLLSPGPTLAPRRACKNCTFLNTPESFNCEVCEVEL